MSIDTKQNVDTNAVESNEGVDAGLNSAADTKNWKAGTALGQALKDEGAAQAPIHETPVNESLPPLFLQDSPDVRRGNAQDEKDATGE